MEKAYETYKDSGIEWIGEIPMQWDSIKLKFLGFLYSGLSGKKGDDFRREDSEFNKHYIPFTNIANNFQIDSEKLDTVEIFENENQNDVKKNDLFFLMSSENYDDIGKTSVLKDELNNTYLNSFCKGFRLYNQEVVDASFLNYLLSGDIYRKILSIEAKGFTRINLQMGKIENLPVIIPNSKQEQTQIATYLDYHTQLIDTLISKKESLIQKLQEQRQAIINEGVTKGLNKNVVLKDSGIEYVGNIAENWSNKRVKHSCYVKGRIGWKGLKSDDYLENGYSYLVTGTDFTGQVVDWSKCHFVNQERYEEDPFIQLEEGDLLITKDGTIGKTTLVKNLDKPACLNSGIFLVRSLIPELDINFLYWVLNSNVFKQFIDLTSTGATIKHLYQNVFIEFAYALPPIEEQIEIQKYLFQKFDEFEVSINKVRTSIQKLKNYRQSLISEAVTGKIDVRDWQEPNNN